MSSFAKFRDGTIGPVIILLAICAVITVALAAIYQVTAPVIKEGEIVAANEVRGAVLPGAASFTEVTGSFPDGVSEVYKADDNSGVVIRSAANGYGGAVTFMIGFDADGAITGINLFDHNETPGLGTKAGEAGYLAQFLGDTDPDSVDAVTGATRTSNALKNAIGQAKEAYAIAKEAA
jgi:electron transport complex protein RnfG